MVDWTKLIVEKGLPIGVAKDDACRRFHNSKCNISKETMRETILEMVPIVEEKIGADMSMSGRGAILHDG